MQTNNSIFRLPEIKNFIGELEKKLISATRPAVEIILDDVDLQKILNVSKRYLASLREQGLIEYSQPIANGKVFYTYQAVLNFISSGKVPTIEQKRKF
jgi:hypothetical protein